MKPRRFEFGRDTFAFANELLWEYRFDSATGKTTFARRQPKPEYAHRCFVLARAARQFFCHARFDSSQDTAEDETYRRLVREIVSRNPRRPSPKNAVVVVPGYADLREFSRVREPLLKSVCGGAWRSYVLRSHWRMLFPISRRHQSRTAAALVAGLRAGIAPIVHLVRFPSLTINHGTVLFDASATPAGWRFDAYDPNDPEKPAVLSFDRSRRVFEWPANRYWAGGRVDVIEIYRNWFL